jgi:hypothetical protein
LLPACLLTTPSLLSKATLIVSSLHVSATRPSCTFQ